MAVAQVMEAGCRRRVDSDGEVVVKCELGLLVRKSNLGPRLKVSYVSCLSSMMILSGRGGGGRGGGRERRNHIKLVDDFKL